MVQESKICTEDRLGPGKRWLLAYAQHIKKYEEGMVRLHSLPPMSKEAEELEQAVRKWTDFFYKHYLEWRLMRNRIDVARYELGEAKDELYKAKANGLERGPVRFVAQKRVFHCESTLIELHEKLDKLVDELANYKW